MISSTTNKQVKFVNALVKKAKTRREEDLFVAEGLRMCSEIPKDRIHTLYISESFSKTKECKTLREGVKHIELVTDEVFKSLSDTQTPQGILALVKQYHYTLDEVTGKTAKEKATASGQDADGSVQNSTKQENRKKPALLMVLETIQDPGNLGTILRAGEGAGVTGVVMDANTTDIYNPKVIRSTMGSVLRMPFVYVEDLHETLQELKNRNIRLFAAHLKGKQAYDLEDYTGDTAFLIGNEGNGLTDETAAMADTYVRIPMEGSVESLNAAVAASVLMFEAARQRRNSQQGNN
ncbi:RNA methyltransferase [Clostridium sp. OF09-36]|uniref:TrmH family RNA methyltransferase n=1 Tax=Clostridium sp. OF09-36 TaxID=2292310 RepID=UPI000E475E8D|nr:RNA methyltransferase [Clostridium sp. OF09-36]RHV89788.1 RNA methyltransferase [Clostridium sp. OF09-36]